MTNMLILYVQDNDQCSDATDLGSFTTDGQSITVTGQSNVDATDDGLEAPFCDIPWPGVWYKFSVTFRARIDVSTCNQADFATLIAVFSGTCGSFVCETLAGGTDGCGGDTTRFVDDVMPGNIYIFLSGNDGQAGNFDLTVSVTDISPPVSGGGRNSYERRMNLKFFPSRVLKPYPSVLKIVVTVS